MTSHRVPLSALGTDGRAVVTLDGEEVALFRVDDRVYALENACPHAGNPLVEGDLAGTTLTCAYHLWRFDVETGACLRGDVPAQAYPVGIVGDDLVIEIPG